MRHLFTSFLVTLIVSAFTVMAAASEHVILLHGLCRTPKSMRSMAKALEKEGYRVTNLAYPSRTLPIEDLSQRYLSPAVKQCKDEGALAIHWVTHSMGGILLRDYLSKNRVENLGKVVMLAPPNQGSEIIDRIGHWKLFQSINGPAGMQLGTGVDSVPNRLGPVTFPLGVIAGSRSINWINSCLIPGRDDGKVSVSRTRVEGMTDHCVLPITHPFIMKRRSAIRQTVHFLRNGIFMKRS